MKKAIKRLTSVLLVFLLMFSNVFMTFAEEAVTKASDASGGDWYVAGTENLCGVGWDPGAAANKMTLNAETGLYEITFTGVTSGSFEFKVTNGTWDECYGVDGGDANISGSLATTGDVLITFNADTKEITWSSDAAGEPETVTYVVAGADALCGSAWNPTDTNNLMLKNDSTKRYEKVYTGVAAGTYQFKVTKNGTYLPGDNQEVTVEKDGTTVIVWYNEADGTVGAELSNDLVIKFYYDRPDGNYENWSLWNWDDVGTSATNTAFTADADGKMVVTYIVVPNATQVGFIVRDPNWNKDIGDDRFVDVSQYVGGVLLVNIKSGEAEWTEDGTNAVVGAKIKSAVSDGGKSIKVTTSADVADYENAFVVKCEGTEIGILSVTKGTEENTYILTFADAFDLQKAYTIEFGGNTYKVTLPSLYKSESFINSYTYEGDDLGATWSKESTTFKVWAPTASDVDLNLYESGTAGTSDLIESIQMTQGEKGVWEVTVPGDLKGTYYTYSVNNAGEVKEACDPYARTTGVNGDRAMVIDLDSTDPEGWENDKNPNADLDMTDVVLYELHVRDASIDESSGVSEKNRGNFLGLTETGTTTEGGKSTVLDHLVDLGITHLHLLPVYDFSSVDETTDGFNWGYDPKNYNVPEGSYSSDPYNGEVRVAEMKEMVQTLHENDISVVMDVVYNHVSDANSFCFNQIVPDYFSRVLENGGYSSNSGCGNDTATEHVMVRKYLVDSINYWAEEYHIDGFRFDLVGLIDVDTINEIMETVWETHPDVIFYGEGWSMNSYDTGVEMTTQPNSALVNGQANNNNNNGFAFFNDTFRDTIKGSVFDLGTGYVSGATGLEKTIEEAFIGLAGGWCTTPTQTINYNSCHDNYTLYDRILLSRTDASEENIVKMNNLAAAINFTSQGVPFIQAGEEFLRSKPDEKSETGYNHNSYNAGDAINSLKWDTLEEATEADVYEYYKGLIAFRKAHAALRMTTAEEVNKYITAMDGLDANVTAFEISGEATDEVSDGLFVIFNPNEKTTTVTLPAGEWNVCINGEEAGTEVLETVSGKVTVDAISAMILVKAQADASDTPTTPTTPRLVIPVSGADFSEVINTINAVEDGTTITVITLDTTVIPAEVFNAISGRDVTINFQVSDAATWVVNGKSIKDKITTSIDLGVTVGSSSIPADKIKALAGDNKTLAISLAHDGAFGFDANLILNVGKENAGKYANLYYYNESTGALEYTQACKVKEDGTVTFNFTHASEYVIVFSDSDMNPALNSGGQTTPVTAAKTGDNSHIAVWMLILALSAAVVAIIGVRKSKKEAV